jgi:hypothetical protein
MKLSQIAYQWDFQTVPNSFIQISYFDKSSLLTDLLTFFKAYKKSSFAKGILTAS